MTNDELLLELRVKSGEWSSLSLTMTNDELFLELRVEIGTKRRQFRIDFYFCVNTNITYVIWVILV